jgi:hypothetical protein
MFYLIIYDFLRYQAMFFRVGTKTEAGLTVADKCSGCRYRGRLRCHGDKALTVRGMEDDVETITSNPVLIISPLVVKIPSNIFVSFSEKRYLCKQRSQRPQESPKQSSRG